MKIALLPSFLLLAPMAAGQGIVEINEIRIDQPSSDNDEYVELRGAAGTVLDGLTYIVLGDGTGGSGVIENVTALSGTIGASGLFVAAESTFTIGTADQTTTFNFENSDNVTHLVVSGFTGADGDDLDIDDDGILDSTPWSAVEDCIGLVETTDGSGEFIYCSETVGPDGTFVPGHVFDCTGTGWTIGLFDPVGGQDTPGAPNTFCAAPPVVVSINEVRIDQPSSDNDEYFELAGNPGDSLDGLTYIVLGDGTGGSGVIESVTDLTGTAIQPDGLAIFAESTFTIGTADYTVSVNFENSDNVTHLVVRDFTGLDGDDLDTDDDGTLDVTPWSEVVSCIGLVETTDGSGEFIYCSETVGPDGTFVPGHAYACDTGGWAIGGFDPASGNDTPGDPNTSCAPPPPVVAINELRIDQPGSDDDEYVELTGNPGDLLDGLHYVVIGDGAGGSGVVENSTDLAGMMIGATGKVVIAEATFTIGTADYVADLNFENSDNVTHLVVRDFTGIVDDDLDTDDDGTLDSTPWSEVVACIGLVETTDGSGDFIYCSETVGPDGTFVPGHAFVCDDGWRIGEFDPASGDDTPGDDNDCDPPATFENYCVSFPNSFSASGAKISYTGSGSISDNDTVLTVSDCPNTFGIFLMADSEGFQAPFYNGVLCLGGSLIRLNPLVKASGNQNSRALDFNGSGPESQILAGQTWYFQYFFRDAGQGADNNLSDGLKATFAN